MNPEQLSKANTESGHQKALFAWANMARLHGFSYANDMNSYSRSSDDFGRGVPALKWLHAIPNGGARDIVTASRMKAEGVRPGIPDIFLPVARFQMGGLYIEMKKPGKSKIAEEQNEFREYCIEAGYAHVFAYTWREGADAIEDYLKG